MIWRSWVGTLVWSKVGSNLGCVVLDLNIYNTAKAEQVRIYFMILLLIWLSSHVFRIFEICHPFLFTFSSSFSTPDQTFKHFCPHKKQTCIINRTCVILPNAKQIFYFFLCIIDFSHCFMLNIHTDSLSLFFMVKTLSLSLLPALFFNYIHLCFCFFLSFSLHVKLCHSSLSLFAQL